MAVLQILWIDCALVYTVIFEGCKIHGFHCKLAQHEILILEKEAVAKETMYDHKMFSDLSSVKYKFL